MLGGQVSLGSALLLCKTAVSQGFSDELSPSVVSGVLNLLLIPKHGGLVYIKMGEYYV